MQTIWRGAISFGLVSIPVRMYAATEEKSLHFNQLHATDHGRVRYRRVCELDGREVPPGDIVKGYEYERDQYVELTDEDLASVPVPTVNTIEIQQFVDEREVDPLYLQRSYYLVPEKLGVKAYQLLRAVVAGQDKVALAKVALRDKEHLALVRARDTVLVLVTMFWPDELRVPAFAELNAGGAEVRPQELKMAQSLVESMTAPFRPEELHDEYRAALEDLIGQKVRGEDVKDAPAPTASKVVDLMEALRASVEANKAPLDHVERLGKQAAADKRRPARKKAVGE